MVLRHLIITWLVISILGYGVAIAADVHYEELVIDRVLMFGETANQADDSHALPAHDQCGHGSFHLLGLNFVPATPSVCSVQIEKSTYLTSWNSLLAPPPSRPPKA